MLKSKRRIQVVFYGMPGDKKDVLAQKILKNFGGNDCETGTFLGSTPERDIECYIPTAKFAACIRALKDAGFKRTGPVNAREAKYKPGFIGKFFLHSGNDYYQHGEVVDHIGNILMLRFDSGEGPDIFSAVAVTTVVEAFSHDGSPDAEWQFFPSQDALEIYLEWLETPSPKENGKEEQKVVPLTH